MEIEVIFVIATVPMEMWVNLRHAQNISGCFFKS